MDKNMKSYKNWFVSWFVSIIFGAFLFSFYMALSVNEGNDDPGQVSEHSESDQVELKMQNEHKTLIEVTSIVDDDDDIFFTNIKPSVAPATPLPSFVFVPLYSVDSSHVLKVPVVASNTLENGVIKDDTSQMKISTMLDEAEQKKIFDKKNQNEERKNLIVDIDDKKINLPSHSNPNKTNFNDNILSINEMPEAGQKLRFREKISFNEPDPQILKVDGTINQVFPEEKSKADFYIQNDNEILNDLNKPLRFGTSIETHNTDDIVHSSDDIIQLDQILIDQTDKELKMDMEKNADVDISKKEMLSFAEWKKKLDTEKEEDGNDIVKTNYTKKKKPPTNSKRTIKKNYASIECGAKVIAANEEATNQIAILKEDKDIYMLNPCNVKAWFVVELCERIELDSIDLANFEMFSSSPESFDVYISSRYPSREWESVGTFQGTPLKEVKTYTFNEKYYAKYLKIEIKKYYGSEHYCPLSLLRVFGITEVEQFDSEDEDDHDSSDDEIPKEKNTNYETINIFTSAKNVVTKLVNTVAEKISGKKLENSTDINSKEIKINEAIYEPVNSREIRTSEVKHEPVQEHFDEVKNESEKHSNYIYLLPDEIDHDASIFVDSFEFMRSSNFNVSINPKSMIWFDHVLHFKTCPVKKFLTHFKHYFNYSKLVHFKIRKKAVKKFKSNFSNVLLPSFKTPLKSDNIELQSSYSFQSLPNTVSIFSSFLIEKSLAIEPDIKENNLSNLYLSANYNVGITTMTDTLNITENKSNDLNISFLKPSRLNIQETYSSLTLTDSSAIVILTVDGNKSTDTTKPVISEYHESELPSNRTVFPLEDVNLISNQTSINATVSVTEVSLNQSISEVSDNASVINPVSFSDNISVSMTSELLEPTNSSTVLETTKTISGLSGSKESIIMKLNAKVKALQANLTLSMMYLDEMSERYRTAVEEVDKRHTSKNLALNLSITSQKEISIAQSLLLYNLSQEIFVLTGQMKNMVQSIEEQKKVIDVQFSLILVEFFLVIVLILVVWCKKTPVFIDQTSQKNLIIQKNIKDEPLDLVAENRKRSFNQQYGEISRCSSVEAVKKKRKKKNRPLDDIDIDAKFSKTAGLLFSAGKGLINGITGAFCWKAFAYEKRSRNTDALLLDDNQKTDVKIKKIQLNRAKSLDFKAIHEKVITNRPRSVGAL
ncbi:SUN domain-containing ossification factor isoform X3 [Hydra vulgaris]|uniref:SUN domain-containing ossification factor isoform X3 n=1 Tax=Hydra vulgaris TaxID=6087 RepID=A0ABM4BED1_HYDVU